MASYNGHHCWNCWNVSLWISNDEGLYRTALECKRVREGRKPSGLHAAARFIAAVGGPDTRTPDGATYNVRSVVNALADLE